jgi:hypothetical protein
MENRHGLVVQATAVVGSGTAEREVAIAQVAALPAGAKTVGGDKGFDQRAFVDAVRATGTTPHVAGQTKYSAIDGRTTRHPGYAVSRRIRKRIEEVFGWMKTVGLLRKLRHRGVARVHWNFVFTAAAYNLVRMRPLAARPASRGHREGPRRPSRRFRRPTYIAIGRENEGRPHYEPLFFSNLLEIFRAEARFLRNACEHLGAELFVVVEGKHAVRPTRPTQGSMGT